MPQSKKIKLKVTVDNHTHDGEPCKKGSSILVTQDVAEMLKKQWSKQDTEK